MNDSASSPPVTDKPELSPLAIFTDLELKEAGHFQGYPIDFSDFTESTTELPTTEIHPLLEPAE